MKTQRTQSYSVTAVRGTAKSKETAMSFAKKSAVWMMVSALLALVAILPGCHLGETVNPLAGTSTVTETDAGADTKTEAPVDAGEEVEITFELPEEWRSAVRGGGMLANWASYVPDSPENIPPSEAEKDENERFHGTQFSLAELGDEQSEVETPEGMAEEYFNSYKWCIEQDECRIEPVLTMQIGESVAYVIQYLNTNQETPLYVGEYTTVFFQKDGRNFEMSIRCQLDDPLVNKTINQVISTMTIKG